MFHYTFFFGKMNHLTLKRINFCRIWYVFCIWAITLYFPLRRCLQVSGGHDYLSPTLKRQRKQPRSIEHLFPHETIIRVRISRRIMNCAQWYQKLIVNCERHAFDDEKRLYILTRRQGPQQTAEFWTSFAIDLLKRPTWSSCYLFQNLKYIPMILNKGRMKNTHWKKYICAT